MYLALVMPRGLQCTSIMCVMMAVGVCGAGCADLRKVAVQRVDLYRLDAEHHHTASARLADVPPHRSKFGSAPQVRVTMPVSAAQFYGFRCTDVKDVHFHKHGCGEGLWFRLKDGRVFAWFGLPSDPDPCFYGTATH